MVFVQYESQVVLLLHNNVGQIGYALVGFNYLDRSIRDLWVSRTPFWMQICTFSKDFAIRKSIKVIRFKSDGKGKFVSKSCLKFVLYGLSFMQLASPKRRYQRQNIFYS